MSTTPTNHLRSVCPECHGAGLVPCPQRPWWAWWRLVKCLDCRGRGWIDPKSSTVTTIKDCMVSSDPKYGKPEPKDDGPEPEAADEWERCPNCRYPIKRVGE